MHEIVIHTTQQHSFAQVLKYLGNHDHLESIISETKLILGFCERACWTIVQIGCQELYQRVLYQQVEVLASPQEQTWERLINVHQTTSAACSAGHERKAARMHMHREIPV